MWYLRAQKKRSSHDQIGLFQGILKTFGRAFPTISCGRPPGEIIQIRKTKNDFCPLSRRFFLANIYLFTLILLPVKCRVSNHLTTHFSLPAILTFYSYRCQMFGPAHDIGLFSCRHNRSLYEERVYFNSFCNRNHVCGCHFCFRSIFPQ